MFKKSPRKASDILTPPELYQAELWYNLDLMLDSDSAIHTWPKYIKNLFLRGFCKFVSTCERFGHDWNWCGEIIDGDILADTYQCKRWGCSYTKTIYNGTNLEVIEKRK